ncbi:dihydrodipicolinate reductase [Streptomyces mirabilis]|uniref:NAD(P)H-dependent amine dehydrogenase family protein n=1 Tax=Streptomyces mirabilis TaxID=68239 RepID=UPI002254AC43|nr:dihydrodipicolinate reductase [Streptomyces mirabilis]MCX5356271.1 dihydrodipicolinate reductase [Streptomyces mirabilis]
MPDQRSHKEPRPANLVGRSERLATKTRHSRYRVAQWATGNIGTRALRCVIEHPRYDLVGVYAHSDAKIGRDAGELCGTGPTGVRATGDIEVILTAGPDCVLYMPAPEGIRIDEMCRLLESGANIVTSVTASDLTPAVRQRIETACECGGTSLYATGSSPGWITEVLPLAVTALQRRLDRLTIEEFADMSARDSPELLCQMFGGDPAAMDLTNLASRLQDGFGTSLRQLADGLSTPLDDITATTSVAVAAKTTKAGAVEIAAGSVAAWRFEVTGLRDGNPFMVIRPTWYVTRDLEPAWEVRDTGWHVVVEGDAPLDIDIRVATENYTAVSPGYTAHIAVNAVPVVCEAPPGIRTTFDLPRMVADLG